MDLILGRFAQTYLEEFSEDELSVFDEILQCQDPDVYDWIVRRADPPVTLRGRVMTLLCSLYVSRV